MSELKIRSAINREWETISTQRTKARKAGSWEWAAHRGAYMEGWAENSIPALIRAKERGFGYSECDLQVTSDGVFVICHNATISGKNANGESVTLTIAQSTAEEVCALKVQTALRFGVIHPCTLDELLNVAYFVGIGVIIHCGGVTTEELGKKVASSVIANGMQGKVIYMPGNFNGANGIASVDKHASIEMCRIDNSNIPEDLSEYTALLEKCDYVGFDLPANYPPTAEAVARIRANGLGLSFWNVNASNHALCLDFKPRALTLQNDKDDFHAWEQTYLESVELW